MPDPNDPKFLQGIDLLRRTGMTSFRVGHTDEEEDAPPVIWHCTGTWRKAIECAAALDPTEALMRLCERVIDGGLCTHCKQLTIFIHDVVDPGEALEMMGCVYAWDPELLTFRRGCE